MSTPGHLEASVTLGDVLAAAGQPEAAAAVLQAACRACGPLRMHSQQKVQVLRQLGLYQVAAGRFEAALASFQEALDCCGEQECEQQLELQACCAAALYPRGGAYAEAATQLLVSVLDSSTSVPAALRQYAVVAADRQLWADVAKVTVRLLAAAPEDRQGQQLLARAVQAVTQLPLLHQLSQQAFKLCSSRSSSSSDWLASSSWRPGPSLESRQAAAGSDRPASSCSCMDDSAVVATWCSSHSDSTSWTSHHSSSRETAGRSRSGSGGSTHEAPAEAARGASSAASLNPSSSSSQSGSRHYLYGPDELDSLALLFTAAKVLYAGGALAAAAQLLQLCAAAAASAEAGVDGGSADATPLYLCGDSHCLPGAWRHVTLNNRRRRLHPLLITGAKVWHLRPDSWRCPRHQFWAALSQLPPGAEVVLLLGEIDCREGLLIAVEKMKYASLSHAVATTVGVYVTLLLQLVQQHTLRIYVHPVPPVLDETRHIVKLFNAALQEGLTKVLHSHPELHQRLAFLDFFQELLTSDGSGLLQQLEFDGSHLHPRYLGHLEAALNAALVD
ncbi:hypothetical protein COO60DRAFT_1662566 [Scenedesmus sp. NREL 46B-D3]|nr:hypothetical protein COO60DRAFT_1662566 [Scenedesmus sp. NREL 46B-D3]